MSTCAAAVQALNSFLCYRSHRSVFAMKRWTAGAPRKHLPDEVGFLAMGHGLTLYLGNMFTLYYSRALAPQLADMPSKRYPSVEAMIADGWEVD